MSHPMWVRGLKLVLICRLMTSFQVAPHVGAWIETRIAANKASAAASHPMWVRGLKLGLPLIRLPPLRRTPCGCVD